MCGASGVATVPLPSRRPTRAGEATSTAYEVCVHAEGPGCYAAGSRVGVLLDGSEASLFLNGAWVRRSFVDVDRGAFDELRLVVNLFGSTGGVRRSAPRAAAVAGAVIAAAARTWAVDA